MLSNTATMNTVHHCIYSVVASLLAVATLPCHAAMTSTSTPVATGGLPYFSDGVSDYFGIVDASATTIGGLAFTPSTTSPSTGDLAGRDIDDGIPANATRTAEWSLNIASIPTAISPFTNISFSGNLAASQNTWDNTTAGNIDLITFELFLDGAVVATDMAAFRSQNALGINDGTLALDTNGDGVGDGTGVSVSGTALALSGVTANSTIVVRATATVNSGTEEFWMNGILSADFDTVPEPSSSFMLALAGGLLVMRRKK